MATARALRNELFLRVRLVGPGLLFAVLTAVGCASGSSEPSEATGSSSAAIQGGTEDRTHPYEVGVCVAGDSGDCSFRCTGTLIAPNLVLTARHCVQEVPSPSAVKCNDLFGSAHGSARITTHYSLVQSTIGWHGVKKIYVPEGDAVCGNDIALLILTANVSAGEAKPVTPAVRYSMTSTKNNFKLVTAIGYGKTSPTADDSGTRRRLEDIKIECVPGHPTMDCGNLNGRMTKNEFVTGDGTCGGDSGSAALEQASFDQGNPLVLGVLSRGGEDGNTCVGGVYTRVDVWRDFIVGVAEEAVTSGGYPRPSWMEPVIPETDAGDGGTKLLPLGAVCASDGECNTKSCATSGGTSLKVCTEDCAGSDPACPSGYTCQSNHCFRADNGAAPPPEKTSGCACDLAGRASDDSTSWKMLGTLALGLAAWASRRRRR
jgi:hypothetical protein